MPGRIRWGRCAFPGTAPDAPRRNALVVLGYLFLLALLTGIVVTLL